MRVGLKAKRMNYSVSLATISPASATAGGQQVFVGAFAEDTWKISPAATVVGGFRLDRWELYDGSRNEFNRATGSPTLTSIFPDRSGYSLNGRLGAIGNVTEQIALRAAAYTGFRVPTLNELYRPFRVGNVITEANAALDPERLVGGEAGIDWRPLKPLHFEATVFYNRLENAIGNITVGVGPGNFDPGGFVPAGVTLRQRQNIDLVTAPGFEFTSDWQVAAPLFLRVSYLFTQPTIDRGERLHARRPLSGANSGERRHGRGRVETGREVAVNCAGTLQQPAI